MLYTAVLARHSQTGACVVQGVEARVCLAENVTFTLTYLVKGDMTRLRIPEAVVLAKDLAITDSHDWWQTIRKTLHEEFAK